MVTKTNPHVPRATCVCACACVCLKELGMGVVSFPPTQAQLPTSALPLGLIPCSRTPAQHGSSREARVAGDGKVGGGS